jgi:hypothetical protein
MTFSSCAFLFAQILDKTIGDEKHFVKCCLSLTPDPKMPAFKEIDISPTDESAIPHLRSHHIKALNNGVKSALSSGELSFVLVTCCRKDVSITISVFGYVHATLSMMAVSLLARIAA